MTRRLVEWAVTIVAAGAFMLVFEAEVAKPYRIPSASMEPTLNCAKPGPECLGDSNERVIANRLSYRFGGTPERGQIVVFTAPATASRCGSADGGSTFVKRLIGLPGDVVSERHGYVYIDGKPLSEPYVAPQDRDRLTRSWGRVPPGRYFFMGDNRAFSCDSRTWGTVPRSSLIGRVVLTYWPPDRAGLH